MPTQQPTPTCGNLTPHDPHPHPIVGGSDLTDDRCPGAPNLAQPVTEDLGDLIRAEAARNPEFAAAAASQAGRCMDADPHPPHRAGTEACPGIAAEPSGDPDPTWTALLDRARNGGEDAADAIIDAYSRGIRAGIDRMAAANTEETAGAAARRFAAELEALARQLVDRGIDIGVNPVGAAIAHIDRLDTALTEATRDSAELASLGERLADDAVRLGDALEVIRDGITADQEIRARALDSAIAFDAVDYAEALTTARTFEAYIRDGHIPPQGDALDAQAAVDIAHERYGRATTDEERAEVISELIGDWWAAWPRTAVTDPWDALAPEIVRMTRAASMVDTVPAYVHRLLDAFLDQAPLNFGTAAVPAEIQSRLTAAVCRGQLGTVRTHGPGAPRHDYHEGECGDLCDNREEQR